MTDHFKLTLKSGDYILTDVSGNITYDSERNYRRSADPSWRIVGISKRFHSANVATLSECATEPAYIGQGWVHDYDHGTHRVWGMPKGRRAVKVERVRGAA